MTKHLNKSARLILLMRLQDAGKLDGLSLSKIARLFDPPPNRSTILRDLRDIKRLRDLLAKWSASSSHPPDGSLSPGPDLPKGQTQ